MSTGVRLPSALSSASTRADTSAASLCGATPWRGWILILRPGSPRKSYVATVTPARSGRSAKAARSACSATPPPILTLPGTSPGSSSDTSRLVAALALLGDPRHHGANHQEQHQDHHNPEPALRTPREPRAFEEITPDAPDAGGPALPPHSHRRHSGKQDQQDSDGEQLDAEDADQYTVEDPGGAVHAPTTPDDATLIRTSGEGDSAMSRELILHGGEDGIRAQRHAGGRPDIDLHLLPGHRHHHLFLAHVGSHPRPACQGGGNHFVVHDDGGAAVPQDVAGPASGQHRVQEEEQPCHHQSPRR